MKPEVKALTARLDALAGDTFGDDVRQLLGDFQRGEAADPAKWIARAGLDALGAFASWLVTLTLWPGLDHEAAILRDEIAETWPRTWDAEAIAQALAMRARVLACVERARLVHEGADQ